MAPYFFRKVLPEKPGLISLDEATSKHCIQVIRMAKGQALNLTDGKGKLATASIINPDNKQCIVNITEISRSKRSATNSFNLAIALTRNKSRNEWLIEKITETGVTHIYPLITEHSEKPKINPQRFEKIMIAAMLQSQQTQLPTLHSQIKFSEFINHLPTEENSQRFIAYCDATLTERPSYLSQIKKSQACLMLIGPEGDFSPEEVQQSLQSGFIPVHLGKHRLRTETAGIYTCMVYNAFQNEDF